MKFRKVVLRLNDIAIAAVSFVVSMYISKRTNLAISTMLAFGIFVVLQQLMFEATKLYKKIWRYGNINLIAIGALSEIAAGVVTMFILESMGAHVNRIIAVMTFVSVLLWTASRVTYVLMYQRGKTGAVCSADEDKKRVMLIGGGEAAEYLLKEIKMNSPYIPVCIIDDAKDKIGQYLCSTKIIGNDECIPEAIEKYKIDLAIFAIYNIDEKRKKEILNICADNNLPVKMLPSYSHFMSNIGNNTGAMRDVEIDDLLGRKKAKLDIPKLNEFLNNKTVFVTGGGGSIGGELCRQIARYKPKKLVIIDVCENGAYSVQQSLKMEGLEQCLEVEIASMTDKVLMDRLFDKYRPDIVYHAAAHKHVPLMEHCRIEAIKNNVFGTRNIVECAHKYEVRRFIMVSTDKAVNPTNIMGATKRLCELIVKGKDTYSKTEFVSVRFGNVLGSNGSVVPLFKEQIKHGGPVTVTSPDCIRYFMTIPEAVELLLTAGSMAQGGETFVLDMGEPVKIDDLARKLIRLSGYVVGKDIEIQYAGMREGEKMYEELLVDGDNVDKTLNEKIFVEKEEILNLDELRAGLAILQKSAEENREEETVDTLKKLVPTYKAG